MLRKDSTEKGAITMASIKMIPEEKATGKVKDIYEEIKSTIGIDFVPNLYKVMASKRSTTHSTVITSDLRAAY